MNVYLHVLYGAIHVMKLVLTIPCNSSETGVLLHEVFFSDLYLNK